ncbi:hypothetical protein FSP39_017527 [Pinctada imbricata]|uniref:Longin domain-containing protein n=1 Tax=Pinctada imbricata TaxID=66713 RepID=A0AA89C4Q2_PINIB|nr:hypothetical protein FSP39_017527 [Pinctada imbricata]
MIHDILISRSTDGLPLASCTDNSSSHDPKAVQNCFTHMKLLSRLSARLPDRCTYIMDGITIHMITALNLTYILSCETSYLPVLAFSCLDDTQKQFLQSVTHQQVDAMTRPYQLIKEFDVPLRRLKQRYSSPGSISNKLNLSTLSQELKLRPPYMLSPDDLRPNKGPSQNYSSTSESNQFAANTKPLPRFLPFSLIIMVSIGLNCLCAFLNLTRGIAVINDAHVEDTSSDHYQYAASFLLCCFFSLYQIYLMCCPLRKGKSLAVATLICTCLCQLYLWEYRNDYQIFFHIVVTFLSTYIVFTRQVPGKLPQYTL